jgi:nucleotide-binding universal stress UspA family protein
MTDKKLIKVLAPIDFQEQSLIILEHAFIYALKAKAELELLHVVDDSIFLIDSAGNKDLLDGITKQSLSQLEQMAKKAEKKLGIPVKASVRKGRVYDQIIQHATGNNAQMIVMGRTDEPEAQSKVIGSNALKVVRGSKIPVINVRGKAPLSEKIDRILLPLDLGKQISEQVTRAIEFGNYFGATIFVVTVLDDDSKGLDMKSESALNKVAKTICDAGVECKAKLLKTEDEPIYDDLDEYADKVGADLVMVMTRAESNLRDFLIGSTAQEIIDYSALPVMSIVPGVTQVEESLANRFVDPLGVINKR